MSVLADSSYSIDYSQASVRTHHSLVYQFNLAEGRGGWVSDAYTPGVTLHYGEEGDMQHGLLVGGNDGAVYQMTGYTDVDSAIGCHIRTVSADQGDARLQKLYGDTWVDAELHGVTAKVKMGYDNYSTLATGQTLSPDSRSPYPINPDSHWVRAKNIATDILFRSTVDGIKFYTWEPRWHEESAPLSAFSWLNPETDFGLDNFVYSGYIYIPHVSTADLTLTFTIDGEAQAGITITNGGGSLYKTFQRLPVMKGKLWKVKLSSTAQFRIDGDDAELLVKQWGRPSGWLRVPLFHDIATSEVAQ